MPGPRSLLGVCPGGGYVQTWDLRGWVPNPLGHETWATMGYSQQAGGMHPTAVADPGFSFLPKWVSLLIILQILTEMYWNAFLLNSESKFCFPSFWLFSG